MLLDTGSDFIAPRLMCPITKRVGNVVVVSRGFRAGVPEPGVCGEAGTNESDETLVLPLKEECFGSVDVL